MNLPTHFPGNLPPFPSFSTPRAVTRGPHEHLLANYFGINAWSPDLRYLLALETDIRRGLPDGRPCTVGLVDLADGNRFLPVMETRTWNFQEAAMAHWIPGRAARRSAPTELRAARTSNPTELRAARRSAPTGDEADLFVVNDLRDGRFVAVVKDWRTGAERIVPHPVSAVSEDGSWALSINYARLYLVRPDYGYAGEGQDPRRGVVFPEDDGLWRVDLATGEARLLVSCAALRGMVPTVPPSGMAYVCHTVISKDGRRFFFLLRSVSQSMEGVKTFQGVNWQTTAFTCNADGTGIRRCFPDGWGASHFNWKPCSQSRRSTPPAPSGGTPLSEGGCLERNPSGGTPLSEGGCLGRVPFGGTPLSERGDPSARTMVVTCNWRNEVYTHVEFTVGEEEKAHRIAGPEMDFDGHCIYSPDGEFVSGDGYWDDAGFRHWKIVRLADGAVRDIGAFFVPKTYRETYSRCDLHPRWRPDGGALAFNSVHEGARQIYLLDCVIPQPTLA